MFNGKTETKCDSNQNYADSYHKDGEHIHTYKDMGRGYKESYRESI